MQESARDPEMFAGLDELVETITAASRSQHEQLRAFRQALAEHLVIPCDAFVIGEPVSLIAFGYDGNLRRGLTARCRRADGAEYEVAAADVIISPRISGGRYLAAYRRWLGLEPNSPDTSWRPLRQRKAAATDIDLDSPIELLVLSVKDVAARCRLLGSDRAITLRATQLWKVVPGEIVRVRPRKHWRYAGHAYLSGEIESTRLDVSTLGLVPLRLEDRGIWDPLDEYWGEPDEPIDDWARPIIARGPRPEFEMEQVLPGADLDDPDSDPITESNDLKDAGDARTAYKILMELCEADIRCLDAHAHLGNFVFDRPAEAIRHYEAGVRIGEQSLSQGFEGLLPWGHIDNRPFLRCMHGYGLCCWRLGRFEEAERVFDRMLWLNPSDNQGVRGLITPVQQRLNWKDD
jgi:tetratricopeptide (TPR) repeat protein